MRAQRSLVVGFGLGACALFGACALTTDLGGLSGGGLAPDAGGGASVDAPADAPLLDAPPGDASDAAPDVVAPMNLYPDGTFESGCPAAGYQSTIKPEALAHGGRQSCRVCGTNQAKETFTIDEDVETLPASGGTYRVEAWVRQAPGATAPPQSLLFLRTYRIDGANTFVPIQEAVSMSNTFDDTWRQISVELTIQTAAPRMDWFAAGNGTGGLSGQCFLVDDVVVTRVR